MNNYRFSNFFEEIQFLSPRINHGLQFIFVINGELTIEIDSRYFVLKELDLLLINRNELFQAQGNETNCVLLLTISDSFMDQYYSEYRNSRFECFSRGRNGKRSDVRKRENCLSN